MRRFISFHEIHVAGGVAAGAPLPSMSREPGRAIISEIEIGRRYKKLDAVATVWEVEACLPDAGAVPHVRLRSVTDPSITRLISASALRNQRFYQLVTPPSTPNPSAPRSGRVGARPQRRS